MKKLNVVHTNAQNFANHYNDFFTFFKNTHPSLISEMWFNFPSFILYRQLSPGFSFRLIHNDWLYATVTHSGLVKVVGAEGVAIYLYCDINCEIVVQSVISVDFPEHVFQKVTLQYTRVVLAIFYDLHLWVDFFEQLESVQADLRIHYEHIIPMGDFNTRRYFELREIGHEDC